MHVVQKNVLVGRYGRRLEYLAPQRVALLRMYLQDERWTITLLQTK